MLRGAIGLTAQQIEPDEGNHNENEKQDVSVWGAPHG